MSKYAIRTLGELCKGHGEYGIAAPAVKFSESLPRYLRITDIADDGFLHSSGYASVDDPKSENYVLQPNDLVIARTGASAGRSYFYDGRDGKLVYAGFLIKFSLDPEKVFPRFVKYYCLSSQYKNWVSGTANGSTRENINAKMLAELPIPVPPLPVQRKIAAVLGALDDKIELNRKMNENLEEMAQALFKSWFVDFEPFGGKMPEGWKEGTFDDIAENVRDRVRTESRVVLSAVSSGNLIPSEQFFTKQVFSKDISKYIVVDENDFAYNPARINIGSIGCNDLGIKGCVSPVYVVARFRKGYEHFIRLFLKTQSFKEQAIQRSNGSVRQILTYESFALTECICPSPESIQNFNKLYCPIYEKQKSIERESRTLAALRDALLPKLMKGEVDVGDLG